MIENIFYECGNTVLVSITVQGCVVCLVIQPQLAIYCSDNKALCECTYLQRKALACVQSSKESPSSLLFEIWANVTALQARGQMVLLLKHTQFQTNKPLSSKHIYTHLYLCEHIWIGIVYGLFLVKSYTELSVFLTNSHTWCDSENSTHEKLNKSSTLISLMLICYIDSAKTTDFTTLGWSWKPHQETIPKCTSTFPSHCFMQLIEWWRKMEEVGGRACGMGDKNP